MPTAGSQGPAEFDMLPDVRIEGNCHPPVLLDGEIIEDWAEFSLYHSLLDLPPENFSGPLYQDMKVSCSRFDFLTRFTSASGLDKSFNSGTVVKLPRRFDSHSQSRSSLNEEISWFDVFGDINLAPTCQSEFISPLGHQWETHPLVLKTLEIVTRLKETVDNKPRRSLIAFTWSPRIETMCFDFFSPENLSRYLGDFWTYWYPNCPIIHRPSFDAINASPVLLASMAILGSCFSSSTDSQSAKLWFDCVEEMVFDDESMQEEHLNIIAGGDTCDQMSFEMLKAAYFVCLFQNWEGSGNAKRRIRRHRFSTVVAYLAMCMSIYQLQNSLVPPAAFLNIERGMDRWKVAWDTMQALRGPVEQPGEKSILDGMWRRDGFMKCAPEYWLLGRVILEKIRSSPSTEGSGAMRMLDKYDQTDMGQVHHLIAQFNGMLIQFK
ncbi:Zinc finger C2H2 type domain containing protein [Penicillium taxi]|uniref:Zinc finger C2H2 type domain containing protein n=1 Tax=Penicillium taxi TaxID=168475 RepID=UPI0025457142|nr:Zinc finger C2H2 type domain containing protein [Penicillium taxi]KAJ5884876.1 Zinc finger C2H2 type domain containing protein [Penicillium taxi]